MKYLNIKLSLFCTLLSLILSPMIAQESAISYYPSTMFTILGKGWEPKTTISNESIAEINTDNYYGRADTSIYTGLPRNTKKLFSNSSGLIIAFKTNSKKIEAKWSLSSYKIGSNMTAIAHSGLDLYIRRDEKWIPAGVGRPSGISSQYTLVNNMDDSEKECLLYLPLYNSIEKLEIGIDKEAIITSIPNPFKNRIAIYGSSITQGASASRPGMSYTARIGRSLDVEIINLGVSGSGKMEKEAAHLTAAVTADMYILDCAANPNPAEITERTNYMVKHIRSKHPKKPIVMIQSVVRESGNFDLKIKDKVQKQNENFETEYKRLTKEGIEDLYFIEGKDLLGHDHEGTTDGVHPNDLGFTRIIDVIQPRLIEILKKYQK